MITVSEIVEKIIVGSPLLEEALYEGLINYSALARKIKPEVQKELMKNVQEGAILMAIRRLSKKIRPKTDVKKILQSNPDLIVRSNLIELVIANIDFSIENHKKLLALAEEQENTFMTITEGVFETTIIASRELLTEIQAILPKRKIIKELLDLSSITIRLPKENIYTPGLYYFFLKSLAWEGINVVEVVSTYTEFTIILEDCEVDRAFSVLKKSLSGKY